MGNINPRVDLAFKKVFGVEENKDLTISLINSIVSKEDQVADITFLNPYNPKNFTRDKLSILDIKAKGVDGKLFNIEMQISDEADYDKRALYYWAKLYTEQLQSGEGYKSLAKTIGIHILNFTSILESKKYHNVFHIKEKETGIAYFKDMELHTIELNKFEEQLSGDLKDFVGRIKTSLDMWSSFLIRHNVLDPKKLPQKLDRPELAKALGVLSHINLDTHEREVYENRLKFLRFENSMVEKGMEIGREEGMELGREEGREKGLGEGIRQVALSLIQDGMDDSRIATLTKLSEAAVKKLREKL